MSPAPPDPTVETIHGADATLCVIIRGACVGAKTAFFTPDHLPLQVGRIVRPAGSEIAAHSHVAVTRSVVGSPEVLLVHKGRTLLDVYADDRTLICTRELKQGDIAVLVGGGHGLRQIEDTILIEVKQGPYGGAGEKEMF
jgi:hypothetical protein